MRHDWELDKEFGMKMMDIMDPARAKRTCNNCGAKQSQVANHLWMRVTGYRWTPLVGRCKGSKEDA